MTKLTKTTLFKDSKPLKETLMDKTTRVVREILDEEAEQRQIKTSRLRKARREREAVPLADAIPPTPSGARKKPQTKAVK
jgi:hypothetical protein